MWCLLKVSPPIGFQDGLIQLIVDLAEDGEEVLIVDLLFLGIEGFFRAKLFQHVVNAGESEAGKEFLLALAMSVETLA
jgi:hypothetical protein